MAASSATTEEDFLFSSSTEIRRWMQDHHKRQLLLLDKFLLELRLGRLSGSADSSTAASPQYVDRRFVTHRTVELIRNMIGSTRWKSAAQLMSLLHWLGRELHAAGGYREPAIGNVVRRIMAAVREEAVVESQEEKRSESSSGGRMSLQTMLWSLPQHVRSTRSLHMRGSGDNQRHESFASEADLEKQYPSSYYTSRPDLKQTIMEAIQELMSDLEDLHRSINDQATNHIHSGEIILTYGVSRTVELFLKAAANKKRQFQVVVCEGAPHYGGHIMAKSLSDAGIETIVINDSAMFAMMARVNKVLLPAHAVLANGGLVTNSGCNLVALAAKHNSVPVVCMTGLFKLCPIYPHEGQDTLNDLVSPNSVIDYAEMSDQNLGDVELVNPVHDYLKPELIHLYVTNVGSFQPDFIYRLMAEYYHSDDWASFEN